MIRKCLQFTLVTLVMLKSHSALTVSEVSPSSTFPQVTCPTVVLVSSVIGNWNNLMCVISVSESFHCNVLSCLYPLTLEYVIFLEIEPNLSIQKTSVL